LVDGVADESDPALPQLVAIVRRATVVAGVDILGL
jgi:hypothetical protein